MRGRDVSYHDPHVAAVRRACVKLHASTASRVGASSTASAVKAAADCVLIVTDHKAVDWSTIGKHASLVVDSRNAMKELLPIAGKYLQA